MNNPNNYGQFPQNAIHRLPFPQNQVIYFNGGAFNPHSVPVYPPVNTASSSFNPVTQMMMQQNQFPGIQSLGFHTGHIPSTATQNFHNQLPLQAPYNALLPNIYGVPQISAVHNPLAVSSLIPPSNTISQNVLQTNDPLSSPQQKKENENELFSPRLPSELVTVSLPQPPLPPPSPKKSPDKEQPAVERDGNANIEISTVDSLVNVDGVVSQEEIEDQLYDMGFVREQQDIPSSPAAITRDIHKRKFDPRRMDYSPNKKKKDSNDRSPMLKNKESPEPTIQQKNKKRKKATQWYRII